MEPLVASGMPSACRNALLDSILGSVLESHRSRISPGAMILEQGPMAWPKGAGARRCCPHTSWGQGTGALGHFPEGPTRGRVSMTNEGLVGSPFRGWPPRRAGLELETSRYSR